MKKTLLLMGSLIVLSGCSMMGMAEIVTTVCRYQDEVWSVEYEFKSQDDALLEERTDMEYRYIDVMTREEIEEDVSALDASYNAVSGVEYSYTFSDETVFEALVVDYESAEANELVSVGLLTPLDDNNTDIYASLEATIANLEEIGSVCISE